jgi:hypothetical protein
MVSQQYPTNMAPLPGGHTSHTAQIIAVVMTLLFISAAAFGIWAFIGMVDNQTDLDAKIATASEVAVQKAETDKEAEFAEREKNPFKTYTGSATYGSLSFDYPKNWSAIAEESNSATVLDLYAHPGVIPGLDDTRFAFRAQIVDKEYATELKSFDSKAERGTVKVRAFKLDKVPDQLGVLIEGEIDTGVQGTLILLPQRDKTIRLYSEAEEYKNDFAKIIDSVTFEP